MVKRKVSKAAAASRKTGGGSQVQEQEPDLLPYEEELLPFLGRDNLLGIEGTTGAETSEDHPQLVEVSSPRTTVVSLQQLATGVQEQGSTERSDGALPLQEEGAITAMDPDSVTSVAK
ncbi:Hypothetical predicted protein [Pelobates cultripes]|uniref:Uncharacterized protein n=1 Tax=Pelobates cultripes TaxID=61616 RepID=A0AAD1TJ97_PELCU|nr:Hypothetical predicted protein [Pelobates cultripes]